ncbi:hypothetical protein V6Z11_A07G239100 [Gossypium hirsutum]
MLFVTCFANLCENLGAVMEWDVDVAWWSDVRYARR